MAFKLAKTIPLVQSDSSVLAGIPILFLCWISLLLGGTVRRRQLSRKSDGGLQGKWSQGFRIGREMGHRSLPDKVAEEMTVQLRLARIFQSARPTTLLVNRRLSAVVGLSHSRHCRVVRGYQPVAASTPVALPTRSIAWRGYNLAKNLVITVQSTFLQGVRFAIGEGSVFHLLLLRAPLVRTRLLEAGVDHVLVILRQISQVAWKNINLYLKAGLDLTWTHLLVIEVMAYLVSIGHPGRSWIEVGVLKKVIFNPSHLNWCSQVK